VIFKGPEADPPPPPPPQATKTAAAAGNNTNRIIRFNMNISFDKKICDPINDVKCTTFYILY
jgi:hypothetical protein